MITVNTNPKKNKFIPYPKLMKCKHSDLIVLFTGINTGTAINDPIEQYDLGFFSSNWSSSDFEQYDGEITLKNKYE